MLRITERQRQLAADILARGFFDDPMWSFILPTPQNRLQVLTAMFEVFVQDGINRGEVLLAPKEQGVIVWYPACISVFGDAFADIETEISAIAAHFGAVKAVERLEKIGRKVQPKAPTIPHHEIFWIALLPEARGKGVGNRLLRPVLDDADAENVGCYLVSSNPRNITVYQRHGFRRSLSVMLKIGLS